MRRLSFAALLLVGLRAPLACSATEAEVSRASATPGADGSAGDAPATDASGGVDVGCECDVRGERDAAVDAPAEASTRAALPTFTPPAGTYSAPQCVIIASSTPGATIHYTVDGTIPTPTSAIYGGPMLVTQPTRFDAIATAPGYDPSLVATAFVTVAIAPGVIAPAFISPASGQFSSPVYVGLATATDPALICYTTDGSEPTCSGAMLPTYSCGPDGGVDAGPPATPDCGASSTPYVAGDPITISGPSGATTVLKAVVCRAGDYPSDVTTATYEML
jgi:hypothetical protein